MNVVLVNSPLSWTDSMAKVIAQKQFRLASGSHWMDGVYQYYVKSKTEICLDFPNNFFLRLSSLHITKPDLLHSPVVLTSIAKIYFFFLKIIPLNEYHTNGSVHHYTKQDETNLNEFKKKILDQTKTTYQNGQTHDLLFVLVLWPHIEEKKIRNEKNEEKN